MDLFSPHGSAIGPTEKSRWLQDRLSQSCKSLVLLRAHLLDRLSHLQRCFGGFLQRIGERRAFVRHCVFCFLKVVGFAISAARFSLSRLHASKRAGVLGAMLLQFDGVLAVQFLLMGVMGKLGLQLLLVGLYLDLLLLCFGLHGLLLPNGVLFHLGFLQFELALC